MWEHAIDFSQIVIADIILSGDNALVIGMAAAGLTPQLRKRAIMFGMAIAALLRIVFSVVATKLLGVPGILFIGGCLLFWVCWRLYQDLREHTEEHAVDALELAEDESRGLYRPAAAHHDVSAAVDHRRRCLHVSRQRTCGCSDRRRRHPEAGVRTWPRHPADGVCGHIDHETSDQIPLDLVAWSCRPVICCK